MLPKFKNQLEYDKAQVLMQPILIRVLDNIRKQSEELNWVVKYEEVEKPLPGYLVHLENNHYSSTNSVWELCFQVCFDNYEQNCETGVEIDHILIDEDGELDWQELEKKTKNIVGNLFQHH